MIGMFNKVIQNFFGNKSDRDIKALLPRVQEINRFGESLTGLSNDELRAKTTEFKARIAQGLDSLNQQLEALKAQPGTEEGAEEQAARFEAYDQTIKERDKALEEILDQILPEAFAVVKETARRFS